MTISPAVLTALLEEEWRLRLDETTQESEAKRAKRKADAADSDYRSANWRLVQTREKLAGNAEALGVIVKRDGVEEIVLERWRTEIAKRMTAEVIG